MRFSRYVLLIPPRNNSSFSLINGKFVNFVCRQVNPTLVSASRSSSRNSLRILGIRLCDVSVANCWYGSRGRYLELATGGFMIEIISCLVVKSFCIIASLVLSSVALDFLVSSLSHSFEIIWALIKRIFSNWRQTISCQMVIAKSLV